MEIWRSEFLFMCSSDTYILNASVTILSAKISLKTPLHFSRFVTHLLICQHKLSEKTSFSNLL